MKVLERGYAIATDAAGNVCVTPNSLKSAIPSPLTSSAADRFPK